MSSNSKINLERKNIVVSRRDLIEESRRESRRESFGGHPSGTGASGGCEKYH